MGFKFINSDEVVRKLKKASSEFPFKGLVMKHMVNIEQLERYYEQMGKDEKRWRRFFNNFSPDMRKLTLTLPKSKVKINVIMNIQKVEIEDV